MVIIGRRKSKNTFGANKIGCRSIMYTILEEEPGDFEPGQLNCHIGRHGRSCQLNMSFVDINQNVIIH